MLNATVRERTEQNGVWGWKFTTKINGASIFVPVDEP